MARPNTITDFPEWKPRTTTRYKLKSAKLDDRKKILRNAASNFVKKKDVRDCIFLHKGNKCYLCGEPATQIDHKISAYQFAVKKEINYLKMNSFDNLFPICAKCNASKIP